MTQVQYVEYLNAEMSSFHLIWANSYVAAVGCVAQRAILTKAWCSSLSTLEYQVVLDSPDSSSLLLATTAQVFQHMISYVGSSVQN